jgi:hypothetical protein
MKFVLTNLLTAYLRFSSILASNQSNQESVIKKDTASGTRLHSTRSQVIHQIPVLTKLPKAASRLKFNSVRTQRVSLFANKMDVFGTSQLLLLLLKLQAHVLTWILMLRTPRRLLSAKPTHKNRPASKKAATGTYQ